MQPQWHDLILLLLPGLIAVICKPHWSAAAKLSVTLAVCFVAALIELFLTGGCNWADFPGTMAKVMALVFGSYAALWKRWQIVDRVEENING
jgi:hypothetical protein